MQSVPPTTSQQVPWTVSNVLRIPLSTPFAYTGGTLCIDIVGDPVLGHGTWWMADAAYEDLQGIVLSRGAGCGSYGGSGGAWAHAGAHSLLPGAWAEFFAYGSAAGPAFAMFGMPAATPLPLATFGLPTPCALHLGSLDILMPALFVPQGPTGPGRADLGFRIPDSAAVFGVTGSVQWLDWQQLATSNAIDWTVAASMPSLGMALIEGHPASPEGQLTVHLAHVLRFEHQ
jgi:hypothetical protein